MFDSEPFLATPFLFLCYLKTTFFCFKVQTAIVQTAIPFRRAFGKRFIHNTESLA